MLFSQTVIHGLYALCYLSRNAPNEIVSSGAVGDAIGVSDSHAPKLLQAFASAGLVRSVRGRRGGYCLARELHEISLADVLDALNPIEDANLLRPRSCPGRTSKVCRAHRGLLQLHARVRQTLSGETLAMLIGPVDENEFAPMSNYLPCESQKENHDAGTVS